MTISTAPMAGAQGPQPMPVTPAKGRMSAILPALAALLCVGYCSSQSLSNAAGCGAPSAAEASSNEANLMGAGQVSPRAAALPVTHAVVQAPSLPVAPVPLPTPVPAPTPPATSTSPVAELLGRYYADLNSNQFDADRYFEPHVERYITMLGTNTGAMNQYIRNVFPKQFKQYNFSLEPGSLVLVQPSQYEFVERSEYYLVAKKKTLKQRVRVRITVSSGGKMTFLEQYKRLPWEELKTPPL
jgi:hypothetical protein